MPRVEKVEGNRREQTITIYLTDGLNNKVIRLDYLEAVNLSHDLSKELDRIHPLLTVPDA